MWAITAHEAWLIKDESGKPLFSMEVKPNLLFNRRKYLFQQKEKIYNKSKLHIVATSRWLEKEVRKSILGKQKIYYIPNGVDQEMYKPRHKETTRQELSLPVSKKIITLMSAGGKHNPQKGWRFAKGVIEHYKDRDDILFLMIGGLEDSEKIDNKNIKFIPYINDEHTFAKYYNASDIFLHTSEAEAFSLVITQALSSGVPVVAFPVGISPEAIKHKESGYIAKYQDTLDLINGVNFLLSKNKNELEEMAKIARGTIINNFTKDKMVKEYIKLYKQILQNE